MQTGTMMLMDLASNLGFVKVGTSNQVKLNYRFNRLITFHKNCIISLLDPFALLIE